jgi:hypothetical protein
MTLEKRRNKNKIWTNFTCRFFLNKIKITYFKFEFSFLCQRSNIKIFINASPLVYSWERGGGVWSVPLLSVLFFCIEPIKIFCCQFTRISSNFSFDPCPSYLFFLQWTFALNVTLHYAFIPALVWQWCHKGFTFFFFQRNRTRKNKNTNSTKRNG